MPIEVADSNRTPNYTVRVLGGASHKDVAWAIAWGKRRLISLATQLRRSTIQRQQDIAGKIRDRQAVVFDRRYYYAVEGKNVSSIEIFFNAYTALWTLTLHTVAAGTRPVLWQARFQSLATVPVPMNGFDADGGNAFGYPHDGTLKISNEGEVNVVAAGGLTLLGTHMDFQVRPQEELGTFFDPTEPLWEATIQKRAETVEQWGIANSSLRTSAIVETPPEYAALTVTASHMVVDLLPIYWEQETDLITYLAQTSIEEWIAGGPLTPVAPGNPRSARLFDASKMITCTFPRDIGLNAATSDRALAIGIAELPTRSLRRHIIEGRTQAAGTVILVDWAGFTGLSWMTLPAADGPFELISPMSVGFPIRPIGLTNVRPGLSIAFSGKATGSITDGVATFNLWLTVWLGPPTSPAEVDFAVIDFTQEDVQPIWQDLRGPVASGVVPLSQIGLNFHNDGSSQYGKRVQDRSVSVGVYPFAGRVAPFLPDGTILGPDPSSTVNGNNPQIDITQSVGSINVVEPVFYEYLELRTDSGSQAGRLPADPPDLPDPVDFPFATYEERQHTVKFARYLTWTNGLVNVEVLSLFNNTGSRELGAVGSFVYVNSGFSRNPVFPEGLVMRDIGTTSWRNIGISSSSPVTGDGQTTHPEKPGTEINSLSFQLREDIKVTPTFDEQNAHIYHKGVLIATVSSDDGNFDDSAVSQSRSSFLNRTTGVQHSIIGTGVLFDDQGNISPDKWGWFGHVRAAGFIAAPTSPSISEARTNIIESSAVRFMIYVPTEWMPFVSESDFQLVSIYWPNAIPFDEDNPTAERNGMLMVWQNDSQFTTAVGALTDAIEADPNDPNIPALRADVLATQLVIMNNFASNDFISALTWPFTSLVILQPTP